MRLSVFYLAILLMLTPCYADVGKHLSPSRAVKVVTVGKRAVRKAHAARNHPHQAHPLIVLDAGHGGKDPGTKVESILEKRLTLSTALLVKRALEVLGYRVVLTRSRDVSLSLQRRVGIANKMEATILVSLHYNSASNPKAKGLEVYYYSSKTDAMRTKESKHLANCALYQIIDQTSMSSRGVRKGNWYVNREAEMPSILIEGGFLTNPEELSHLKNRDFLNKLAEGIARGIDKYLKS